MGKSVSFATCRSESSDSVEKLCPTSSGGVSRGDELVYSVMLSFLFPSLLYLINPLGRVAFGRGVPYAVQRVGAGSRCVSHRASRFRFWAVAALDSSVNPMDMDMGGIDPAPTSLDLSDSQDAEMGSNTRRTRRAVDVCSECGRPVIAPARPRA
jgi:hypothetical protein